MCWEHGVLGHIVEKLGVKGKVKYPGDRFDIIWAVREPYETLEWVGSEGVEGLDEGEQEMPVPIVGGDGEGASEDK